MDDDIEYGKPGERPFVPFTLLGTVDDPAVKPGNVSIEAHKEAIVVEIATARIASKLRAA